MRKLSSPEFVLFEFRPEIHRRLISLTSSEEPCHIQSEIFTSCADKLEGYSLILLRDNK